MSSKQITFSISLSLPWFITQKRQQKVHNLARTYDNFANTQTTTMKPHKTKTQDVIRVRGSSLHSRCSSRWGSCHVPSTVTPGLQRCALLPHQGTSQRRRHWRILGSTRRHACSRSCSSPPEVVAPWTLCLKMCMGWFQRGIVKNKWLVLLQSH